MINETINQTALTFENVTAITLQPYFLLALLGTWLIPLIIYFIVGAVAKARSPSGQVYSKSMISYPNFWFAFIIYFFIQSALMLILIVFPLWLKIWGGS